MSLTNASRSTLVKHVIPQLYVCYLLRSKKDGKFSNRTYVGSSPDPPRRIRQHNGDLANGGAVKTRIARPWEMEAIVHGFPSKLAALQFEWAWQKPFLSRHLKRVVNGELVNHILNTKSGQNHPQCKVAVMQRMLVSKPWNTMDLSVTLFSVDAMVWWNDAAANGSENPKKNGKPASNQVVNLQLGLPDVSVVQIAHRHEGVDGNRLAREDPSHSAPPLGPFETDDWSWAEPQWTKWTRLVDQPLQCGCCSLPIDRTSPDSFLVCTSGACSSTNHTDCLAQSFLSQNTDNDSMLPIKGSCPECKQEVHWQSLVRSLYRRQDAENGAYKRRLKGLAALEQESDELDEPTSPAKRRKMTETPVVKKTPTKRVKKPATVSSSPSQAMSTLALEATEPAFDAGTLYQPTSDLET